MVVPPWSLWWVEDSCLKSPHSPRHARIRGVQIAHYWTKATPCSHEGCMATRYRPRPPPLGHDTKLTNRVFCQRRTTCTRGSTLLTNRQLLRVNVVHSLETPRKFFCSKNILTYFLPPSISKLRDLNPGPSAPETSSLTTRLPSHPGQSVAGAIQMTRSYNSTGIKS